MTTTIFNESFDVLCDAASLYIALFSIVNFSMLCFIVLSKQCERKMDEMGSVGAVRKLISSVDLALYIFQYIFVEYEANSSIGVNVIVIRIFAMVYCLLGLFIILFHKISEHMIINR